MCVSKPSKKLNYIRLSTLKQKEAAQEETRLENGPTFIHYPPPAK